MWGAGRPARFAEHLVAADLKGGYQVLAVDVNRDGRPDLIALASGQDQLVWFENPGWERHIIARGFRRMINLAAWDTDGDGIPEIVLASDFANQARNSIGVISLLEHNGDPRQPWRVREIDRLTTSHRLRWADIEGNGKKVLVDQPLTGANAQAPDYRGHTPLVFYRPGEWKRQTIGDQNQGVVHGIYVADWDGRGREAILTASFVGIDRYQLGADGRWTRTELARGDPSPWPKSGASDVALGRLAKRKILVSIEPWHGDKVAVYRQRGEAWEREVIDDTLVSGHTILTADLNRDWRDEVIAGFRGNGQSVYVYYAEDGQGRRWTRTVLDPGGIAASACAVADINRDGRPDITCIGAANLKWYENLGPG
jgi:hypothetical protein